jgi:hypothetical protein
MFCIMSARLLLRFSLPCCSLRCYSLLCCSPISLECLLASIRRHLGGSWSLRSSIILGFDVGFHNRLVASILWSSMLASMLLASMLLAYIARMLACFYPSSLGCFLVASTLDTWFRCRLPYSFGAATLASILASIFADWTPGRLAAPTLMLRHLALCLVASIVAFNACFVTAHFDDANRSVASILCSSMLASMPLASIARMLACVLLSVVAWLLLGRFDP